MFKREYRSIDKKLNALINSIAKILNPDADSSDLEFEKNNKSITSILKKLFEDNSIAEKYIEKFNQIKCFYNERTEDSFKRTRESLLYLIDEAIEEIGEVYDRNFKFISNCNLPYSSYRKALNLYNMYSSELEAKRKTVAVMSC
jgi:hypothetical protein